MWYLAQPVGTYNQKALGTPSPQVHRKGVREQSRLN